MPTVIVYRRDLLPASETFIRSQVLAYQRWHPILVGKRLCHQLPLDNLDTIILERAPPAYIERIISLIRRRFRISPNLSTVVAREPDLLHAHFGVDAIEAAPIAEALGIPMMVTLHGFDINVKAEWWEGGFGGAAMRSYPRELLRIADNPRVHFIAVSDSIRRRAVDFGIRPGKITTRHIGVDTAVFQPGPLPIAARPRRILFVGRLVEKKGCEYLLRAAAIAKHQVDNLELVIIGDGTLMDSLKNQSSRLGLVADFRGVCSSEEVRREFDIARVFCLPSITAANGDAEGLPIVLLESQAKGVPVITSAGGGSAEGFIDGETGYIFEESNVEQLAEKLVTVLTNDSIATRMAAVGPSYIAEKFDIHSCTRALELVYDEYVLRGNS